MRKQVIINNEIWHYEVDETGNVYNTETQKELKGTIKNGYKIVQLWKSNKPSIQKVHRLVAQAFLSNPQNLPVVHHKDNNRLNNSIENLAWTSYIENNQYENTLTPSSHFREVIETDEDVWLPFRNSIYLISNTGKVKNSKTNKLLKGSLTDDGYIRYDLRLPHEGKKHYFGHRIVYETFCGNLVDGLVINHIDGNKLNNHMDNLEQITIQKNQEHSHKVLKNYQGKPVYQYDLNGDFIRSFVSYHEAERVTGLRIWSCLKEKTIQCGNFFFVYNTVQLEEKMTKFNDYQAKCRNERHLNGEDIV